MKLKEAREILTQAPIDYSHLLDQDLVDAMKVGEQAISRIEQMRIPGGSLADYSLPSETER